MMGDEESGIRNFGIIPVLVDKVRKEPDLYIAAATYLLDIARNQPFLDRNRRTALASAAIFLRMNGKKVKIPEKKMPDFMNKAKDGQYTVEQVAGMIKDLSKSKKAKSFDKSLKWYLDKYPDLIKTLGDLK